MSSQLEQWRRRSDRGRRIPERFWKEAVRLAREHGVSRIAQALRLDYYSIKARLEMADPPPQATGSGSADRFVELPLRAMSAVASCVLEVEHERGARLRLELQGLGAGELAGVVRAVWSDAR